MDCEKGMENHSGIDGDFTSHKSTAICWSYQKAKGITKRGQHPSKGAVLFYLLNGISFCWVYSFCPVGTIFSPLQH